MDARDGLVLFLVSWGALFFLCLLFKIHHVRACRKEECSVCFYDSPGA